MKEESAMRRDLVPKKGERSDDALARLFVRNKASLFRDTDGGEAKTAGCNAGHRIGILDVDIAAISD